MVVSAPFVAIMYPNTLLDPLFATYAILELIPPPFPNPPSPPPPSGHPLKSIAIGSASHDGTRIFMWCPLVRLQCETSIPRITRGNTYTN